MLRKNNHFFSFLIILSCFVLPIKANSKVFQTKFIKFDIPKNWACKKSKRAWVCQSTNKRESKEAFYILAAKALGPEDTLENLTRQLSNPKSIKSKGRNPVFSVILDKGNKSLNNQTWFSSTHMNSEIRDYQSTYFSTLTKSLSLLLSMHVSKNYLIKYQGNFKLTESSLQLKSFKLKKGLTRAAPENSNQDEYEEFETIELERKKKLPLIPIAGGAMVLIAGFILYSSFKD